MEIFLFSFSPKRIFTSVSFLYPVNIFLYNILVCTLLIHALFTFINKKNPYKIHSCMFYLFYEIFVCLWNIQS